MAKKARNGKVASLPADIREELNQRLLDGQGGPQILPWLNKLPCVVERMQVYGRGSRVEITFQNLSEWRLGGYRDWLDQHEQHLAKLGPLRK